MLNLSNLKNIYRILAEIKEGTKQFKRKMAKNLIELEKLIYELENDLKPLPEYLKYQEEIQNAKADEIVKIRERYKTVLKKQKARNEYVNKKYSSYKIDLEEFKESELPKELSVETWKVLMQLGLIKN